MQHTSAERILQEHNIKPTANRLLVFSTLQKAENALSMTDIEDILETIDKSSISRCLSLFGTHHLIHEIEDGSGSVKYEICNAHHDEEHHNDMHTHFHCTICQQTYCLKEIEVPKVSLPKGYTAISLNYVIKGICPDCQSKNKNI